MSARQFWGLTMAIAVGMAVHDLMETIGRAIAMWMGFR